MVTDSTDNAAQSGWSVIVAGSRAITDVLSKEGQRKLVANTIAASGFPIQEVVSGTARGVDQLGEEWAVERDIPVVRFPADWDIHGRAAGPIRNEEMAAYADALVAIRVDNSHGTGDMIRKARSQLGRERVATVELSSDP